MVWRVHGIDVQSTFSFCEQKLFKKSQMLGGNRRYKNYFLDNFMDEQLKTEMQKSCSSVIEVMHENYCLYRLT